MRVKFVILLFLLSLNMRAFAQQSTKAFVKLSCPEKCWVITHPFIACKAYKLTVKARETSKELLNDPQLDHDANGGQVDAFRHAYWMALLSQKIAPRKARKLGRAHEKGDYIAFKKSRLEDNALPDSMAGVMDLYNNEQGITVGSAGKALPEEELKQLVKQKILAGEMKVLMKTTSGKYLTCDGKEIDIDQYHHQWSIPKCLVNSDWKEKQ